MGLLNDSIYIRTPRMARDKKKTKFNNNNYLKVIDPQAKTEDKKVRNYVSIPIPIIPHMYETIEELICCGDEWTRMIQKCKGDLKKLQDLCIDLQFGNVKTALEDVTLRLVKFRMNGATTVNVVFTLVQQVNGKPLPNPVLDLSIYKNQIAQNIREEIRFQQAEGFDVILSLLFNHKSKLTQQEMDIEVKVMKDGSNEQGSTSKDESPDYRDQSPSYTYPNYTPSRKRKRNQQGAGTSRDNDLSWDSDENDNAQSQKMKNSKNY